MFSSTTKALALLLTSCSLFSSDTKTPDLNSIATSRARGGPASASSSSSAAFDERGLRLQAILNDRDLSPFVAYENDGDSEVTLTLLDFSEVENNAILVFNRGITATMDLVHSDRVVIPAGATAYFASQKPMGKPFANACFSLSGHRGTARFIAMWFQPLARGKNRVAEIPEMNQLALTNALNNWARRQKAVDDGAVWKLGGSEQH